MNAAFKEWAVICEALGEGKQNVLIRKGGIAEGRDGFGFKHNEFLLFPTWFHEQLEKTILPQDTILPKQSEDEIEFRYAIQVEWTRFVEDFDILKRLRNFHVWHDSVLEERFTYREIHGVHVAFVRVFRLEPFIRVKMEKRFGGCRSWIELPKMQDHTYVSVISDEEHGERRKHLESLLF